MSLEGPCSVIRGGMHGFPFIVGNGSRSATRDQPQRQQLHHQQQSNPMQHRFNALASNSWEAPAAPDDSILMPEELHPPRLRSVSSLVLHDFDDMSHVPHVPGSSISRVRRPREQQQPDAAAAAAAALNDGMNEILNAMPLPPPTNGVDESLTRQQSFPPPNVFPRGGNPSLRRDPSFPPPVQPGLSMDIIEGSVSDWPGRRMEAPATVDGGDGLGDVGWVGGGGLGGVGGGGGCKDGRGCVRGGGGEARHSSEFHDNNIGGEALRVTQQSNSSNEDQVKWEHLDSVSSDGRRTSPSGDDDSVFLDAPSRPFQHTRRPSFDKLAAMIPDIPVRWPSPSSSPAAASAVELINSNHGPNVDKPKSALVTPTLDPAQPTRGRPCTRPGRPRKTLDDDLFRGGIGGGARQGKKLGGSKRGDAPLSCGPASRGGGPVDLARQARRTAKIQRYLYKRSRRKFANSTRDASPSRSRPKAARVRPREKGKFVKTVPDFIPVTAVATDNFVEMDMNHTAAGAGGVRTARLGLGNGMGIGVGVGECGGPAKRGEVAKRPMVKLGPNSQAWRNTLFQCPGNGAVVPPVHGAATDEVGRFYCPPSPM